MEAGSVDAGADTGYGRYTGELAGMDEVHFPKKGFEDLYNALMEEYKREIQAIIDEVENKGRRNEDRRSDEEFKDWLARLGAEATARIEALDERYKPLSRHGRCNN